MKKLIFVLVCLLIVVIVGQIVQVSLCDYPIRYRVDTVDPKFNLKQDVFIEDTKKAADIWNKVYGKDMLTFDPKGELSVNLIYDERQLLTSQINSLESQINRKKSSLDPLIAQYEKDVESFKTRLADLNKQIQEWNAKGGAPADVYNELIQKQKDLKAEADRLNSTAKSLNVTTQDFNSQIGKLNKTVDNFNAAIEQRPEEGIYLGDQNRIEVYFYTTKPELIHTLAHELGHSRGFEHTISPESIMYSKTNESLIPTKDDLEELKRVCAKRSLYEIVLSRTMQLIRRYKDSLT